MTNAPKWDMARVRATDAPIPKPIAPGLNGGTIGPNIAPDHWRASQRSAEKDRRVGQAPHSGSPHSARFGARPWAGDSGEAWTPVGVGSGDAYVAEYDRAHGIAPEPKPKTRMQRASLVFLRSWVEQGRADDLRPTVRDHIDAIASTDPAQARAYWIYAHAGQ